MSFLLAIIAVMVLLLLGGAIYTRWQTRRIERNYPNIGKLSDVGGFAMNALHIPRPDTADLPALVFIHGASGNLRDQLLAFEPALRGRAEMLFPDRPGHGYSERGGPANALPSGQADAIARLMDVRGIDRAIIVGHSFGAAIAAAFAVRHPEKTIGLLVLAPATHAWPGGVDWYYRLAATPFLGWLFCRTLLMPLGLSRIKDATTAVFDPNPLPPEYIENTAPSLVLRASTFRYNSEDIVRLCPYLKTEAPAYRTISAPSIIITGDSDRIVWEHLHARGLQRDISGADYIRVDGIGHKPDYCATGVAIASIEKLAGQQQDKTMLHIVDEPSHSAGCT